MVGGTDSSLRRKAFSEFLSGGDLFQISAGERKRFVALTDFDEFVKVFVHRASDRSRRSWCPKTLDDQADCRLCSSGVPRTTLAAVSVYDVSSGSRKVALWSGAKRGVLNQLFTIFETFGTHKVLVEIIREGEGLQTNYQLVPLGQDVKSVVPDNVVPHTREELLRVAEDILVSSESTW